MKVLDTKIGKADGMTCRTEGCGGYARYRVSTNAGGLPQVAWSLQGHYCLEHAQARVLELRPAAFARNAKRQAEAAEAHAAWRAGWEASQ